MGKHSPKLCFINTYYNIFYLNNIFKSNIPVMFPNNLNNMFYNMFYKVSRVWNFCIMNYETNLISNFKKLLIVLSSSKIATRRVFVIDINASWLQIKNKLIFLHLPTHEFGWLIASNYCWIVEVLRLSWCFVLDTAAQYAECFINTGSNFTKM